MNKSRLISAAALLAFSVVAQAAETVDVDNTGLVKGSVFETPTPSASMVGGPKPVVDAPGAPPQIPHDISGYTPVTLANNMCMGCHDKPALRGVKSPGVPTAMPVTHYQNTRDGNAEGKKVRGQRYVCTQCHRPQMDVVPPVANKF